MTHPEPTPTRRPRALRLAACGALVAAGLVVAAAAGPALAATAKPSAYVVTGKVTANSYPRAKSFAVRASKTSTTARTLRGKVVVIQVGVLTRVRNPKGRAVALKGLKIGTPVSVTWQAKAGTPAIVASVDAPRLVVTVAAKKKR